MKPPAQPPRAADRLLALFCAPHLLEAVQGDLHEEFVLQVERMGERKARWWYWREVLGFLKPFAVRRQSNEFNQAFFLHPAMLRNYFKIAWRNLRKQPGFAFINVFGLAAGLTCFAGIALWVADERSYDRFHRNYDRIVRVVGTQQTETGTSESAVTSAPMAKALQHDFAEVENAVRLDTRGEVVRYKNQSWMEPDIVLTDPSFFDVFSYSLIRGNAATALSEPYSVVLTESAARKYFGTAEPMGQVLTIFMFDSTGRGANYTVTGITPDPPQNAHFTFSILGSFKTIETANPDVLTIDGWGDSSFYTYLLLKKGVDAQAFTAKIAQFYTKYIGDLAPVWRAIYSYQVQPLKDIHLRSHLDHEIAANGSVEQVYLFAGIGIFILLLVCINYTNLATARSVGRAKEVGIKKVVGAVKTQLVAQYLVESALVAFLALVLSGLFALLLQPFLHDLTGKNLSLFASPALLFFLVGLTGVLGVLSGVYPAFVLSSFKPASVLKGSFKGSNKGVLLRQSLVVLQFVVTLVLVSGIAVVYAQLAFIKAKNLGYDQSALLFVRLNGNADVIKGYEAFRQTLTANPLVAGMTTSNSLIFNGLSDGGAQTVDRENKSIQVNTARLQVDTDYLKVHGIKLIAGQNFTTRRPGGAVRQVILNETAVKRFGWPGPEKAIGKPFSMGGQAGNVVGVVRDFHFNSLQHDIQPLAMYPGDGYFSRITLKIDGKRVAQSVKLVERAWKKRFPDALFDFGFMDEQLDAQYRAEERFSAIVSIFSVLSLLIACLGLYGLITHSTAQRVKEIGIRKVLGATAGGIVLMLSKDFLKLIVVASLVAVPVAWYATRAWLQDFAYRIEVEWWMFAGTVALVLVTAWLTIGFQSLKAALTNPVNSLRSE